MARTPLEFTLTHTNNIRNPLSKIYPWHILCEVSSNRSQEDADETLQAILETALTDNIIKDAAVSTSLSQVQEFWHIREMMPVSQRYEGGSMKHDISVPLHLIPDFLKQADAIVMQEIPEARLCTFGHLGDGNIHYNISQPKDADKEAFLSNQPEINNLIHDLVMTMNGSVAAEHGVGKLKRDLIARTKNPVEMNLMRSIKQTLDPYNIMNPGKVL